MDATKPAVSDRPVFGFWREYVLIGLLGALIACIVILSCVPPVSKDALVHHLAVPKLYLKHGGLYEIPSMTFSYYPMNLDLLYMLPLYFGKDMVPKFIHFAFALLTAWLVFGYLKRRTPRAYALFGALFFLSIPIIVKLSITAYVDLGVVFFSTASLLLVLRWVETGFRFRFLALSGIMCGLAMGTKYNGLIVFFLLTLAVSLLFSTCARGKRPGFLQSAAQGLVFVSIALLVFSPWMVRNYHWKRNPIYPLFDSHFNAPSCSVSEDKQLLDTGLNAGLGVLVIRKALYNEGWWEIALVPVRVFFQGRDGSPKYFDGKLNPFLLFLPILAFYRIREDSRDLQTEKKVMLAFAILFFAFAFFSSDLRIRYFSPVVPPLVILSVLGVHKIVNKMTSAPPRTVQRLGLAFIFLISASALAYNVSYVIGQFSSVRPFEYLGAHLDRHDYISRYRPEYPAIRYMNERLPPDSLTLFIFLGNRGYYFERDYQFGEGLFSTVIANSQTAEEVLERLRAMGVTHLFIYYDIFESWLQNNSFFGKKCIIDNFMSNYVKVIYYKNGFVVLKLLILLS